MKQELRAGDILIFQADDKWISKLIAWGTFSDVSHAAMIYGEGQMVEMGLDGIMVNKIQEGGGETAYLMRLDAEQDSTPLVQAANRYLDAKICYDVPALVLLGVALIYRHFHPSTRVYQAMDKLLTLICISADKLIGKLLQHPDAMVCSQLVYQIYQDCGGAYKLDIQNGVLQSQAGDVVRLVDFAEHAEALCMDQVEAFPNLDIESLCQELFDALQQTACENGLTAPPEGLSAKTRALLDRLNHLSELTGVPLDALRVMPADLAYHTRNLKRIEQLKLERLERIR